ncbi:PREDICTED: zinc finger CCCH domain-containing protein 13-like isoform X4 [Papilio xuthus]|uniref:Zinc finger CCCH domain-containing protein 13-like isoform X4 n=1 Tax=Papilio xuthus TaxID=66420 RepID=A0AAJ7ED92_PAPXU|nr:PREDICTED: zinc finger CCCH domain-containing protein 13-like isoform X4 [Papilio xuthus]
MLSVSKPASLVQQKKQQWAREREEMSQLYLPWGAGERYTTRLQVRNQFASSLELHKQSSYEYQEPVQRQRSPSLPPIHQIDAGKQIKEDRRYKEVLNRNISSAKRFSFYDEDGEGDTSGYGSETVNHMNIRNQNGTSDRNPVVAWQQDGKENRKQNVSVRGGTTAIDSTWSTRSPAPEEGRPRWGDRGVATGRLWEPTAPTARLPQMQIQKKGTPSWVERGLNMLDNTSDVLVVDQRSSTNSGLDCDRSSCNGSEEGKTFLRGQNVPLEPEVRAQRENKRTKALELQSAILNQLEDREKRRQEERERQLREDRLEEIRIKRQQEEDRLKMEEEKRKHEEKQMMEQRKLDALKKALEDAERKARNEKEKKFKCHRQMCNSTESVFEDENPKLCENVTVEKPQRNDLISPTKSSRTYDIHSPKSQKKDCSSRQSTAFNSPRPMGAGINGNGEIVSTQPNSLQLAVLVPQNLSNNNLYNVSVNPLNNNDILEGRKIITPQKYRTLRTKDAFTQTEADLLRYKVDKNVETIDIERDIDKDYPNIDENAPQDGGRGTFKKDRRLRSEERYKKDIENRPKWGANKPVAQYKKQSEKDPFYSQKRKVRQKHRPQARQYMSQSSDDSRSPSPPTRSDKIAEGSFKQRNSLSQSYWRHKLSNSDSRNNNAGGPSTDVPEFCSLDQITGERLEHNKLPKRLTLSQKFINDKYGTRKLWMDDVSERGSKYLEVENPKRNADKFNIFKRDIVSNEEQDNFVKLKS